MSGGAADGGLEQLLRELAPRVLGAVVRRCDDFAAAEDAVQEALVAALAAWPRGGPPANPGGWLFQVACRRLVDQRRGDEARLRRALAAAGEQPQADWPSAEAGEADGAQGGEQDDTLHLLFTCCHPALTPPSAIALTLRAVGGLTTAEIANAFLVPEATMAQRISRAKQSIKASGIPFRPPTARERAERLKAVLHVLYLIFNEGYVSSSGVHLIRVELAAEALRLARALHRLLPDEGEVAGLLALMLLTDARRRARTGEHGELVPLDEQDRSLWDRAAIEEGVALVSATLPRGAVGPFQLQAAIAAVHGEAGRAEDTDWHEILALYGLLERMSDNPMVSLNRVVAAAMVHGPVIGLEQLQALESDPRIAGHHRLEAVRAHLLEFAGDSRAAIEHYRAAARATTSLPERHYLTMRAARLAPGG